MSTGERGARQEANLPSLRCQMSQEHFVMWKKMILYDYLEIEENRSVRDPKMFVLFFA